MPLRCRQIDIELATGVRLTVDAMVDADGPWVLQHRRKAAYAEVPFSSLERLSKWRRIATEGPSVVTDIS